MKAYIPPNIEESGMVLGGLFKTRNFIEAGVGLGLSVLVFKSLFFLPIYVRIGITVAIGVLLVIFALIGISGKPVSIYFLDILNFYRNKKVVSLDKPRPIVETTEKERKFRFKGFRKE